MIRIGIDLGGTKTEVIALDDRRNELLRRREPTPAGDYGATLALIARLVRETESAIGKRGSVGVGTPGALSPATRRLRNSNSTCLNGQPLKEDLERAIGREIRMENDANCFALSEATDGAARKCSSAFGVILGTGVGGGIVIDGRVVTGANAIAGEWGHNPLPWPRSDELPGLPCYCGRRGCIETFLSGPGLAADYAAATGRNVPAETLVQASLDGHSDAMRSLGRYEERLARGLASVINVLDPEVIVLGGGLSNVDRLLHERAAVVGRVGVLRHRAYTTRAQSSWRFERRAWRGASLGNGLTDDRENTVGRHRTVAPHISRLAMLILRRIGRTGTPQGWWNRTRTAGRSQARSGGRSGPLRSRVPIRGQLSRNGTLRWREGGSVLPRRDERRGRAPPGCGGSADPSTTSGAG